MGPDAAIEKRYDYAEGVGWAGANENKGVTVEGATKPFWYWTYPTTYANGEDYLLSPSAVEATINLLKVGGDAVILAGAIGNSVKVYNTAGTSDDNNNWNPC
ncbi:hypothetical protein [Weissella confusa]